MGKREASALAAERPAEALKSATKKGKKAASPDAASGLPENAIEVVNPAVLASRDELRRAFTAAEPYQHGQLKDVFKPEVLDQIRDEIIENIQATYKETDLFKLFQTGDMGNLDRLGKDAVKKVPALTKLKEALYSEEFRAFVRAVTGCGELSDKTDCSCNVYATGCHLLCHDDVIGTRRVSWIIYLSDASEGEWGEEDGGALELYPLVEGQMHTPSACPALNLLPTFNSMAFFTVLPGKSFHAVQEVFAEGKPRMSISGWYHAPEEPEGMDKASLQQLQMRAGEDNATEYEPFKGEGPSSEAFSEDDAAFLIRYLNPTYLSEDAWPRIRAKFAEEGSVELKSFLKPALAKRIAAAAAAEDRADGFEPGSRPPSYQAGGRDGWAIVGPPHKQRFVRFEGAEASSVAGPEADAAKPGLCGALLAHVQNKVFKSAAFARLLKQMTSITLLGQQAEVRRFRPGLDYTVAHYGVLTQDPRLDVVLTFVDDSDEGKSEAWATGEVGGFEAYLLADDDAEGAAAEEVYRQDAEESGVLNVSAASNTLSLVLRDEGLMRFVKYVSFQAPSSRWDIRMEYQPEDDSDDEEEPEAAAKEGKETGDAGAGPSSKQAKGGKPPKPAGKPSKGKAK